jgi:hypothetical protein
MASSVPFCDPYKPRDESVAVLENKMGQEFFG